MDKTTKTQNAPSENKENIMDGRLLKKKFVHHDFTVKAMDVGSDFTVLEHKTIKKYNKNS